VRDHPEPGDPLSWDAVARGYDAFCLDAAECKARFIAHVLDQDVALARPANPVGTDREDQQQRKEAHMNDTARAREIERELTRHADNRLIKSWQRHPARAGHYLIRPATGNTAETRSLDETEMFCTALCSAEQAGAPLGLVGVSRQFPEPREIDQLVRAAAGALEGEAGVSIEQRTLAYRAYQLVKLEILSVQMRGRMVDGYDGPLVNVVFDVLSELSGLSLVCVWQERYASTGPRGSSKFYLEDNDGGLWRLEGDVREWLTGDPADPLTPELPLDPSTWRGIGAGFTTRVLEWHDGRRNYAHRDTGG
jgi:hypothetical protein